MNTQLIYRRLCAGYSRAHRERKAFMLLSISKAASRASGLIDSMLLATPAFYHRKHRNRAYFAVESIYFEAAWALVISRTASSYSSIALPRIFRLLELRRYAARRTARRWS